MIFLIILEMPREHADFDVTKKQPKKSIERLCGALADEILRKGGYLRGNVLTLGGGLKCHTQIPHEITSQLRLPFWGFILTKKKQ